jgi:MurNAc alpha-1-phosphate uridylyltransferase
LNRRRKPLALRADPAAKAPATAMILAAGLGKRMRPLTATRPKPLVEVAGKPLIDHAMDRLRSAGIGKAVVNVHYLADSVEAHLGRCAGGLDIKISDERALLLETGGGVAKALPLIESDPFLVINSDNLWIDGAADSLRMLAASWDEEKMDALLLVVPLARAHCHSGRGDFILSPAGALRRRRARSVAPFVYTGVQMVSKRLFAGKLSEGPFSFNLLWDRAIAAGRAFGMVHEGLWFDIGRPESIRQAERMLKAG